MEPEGGWSWPAALLPDGVRLRMVEANGQRFELAEGGEGDRLALCLHGFPELALSWRHQMPVLAAMGWRVWAPNLRGYGASSRPEGVSSYAIEHLLDDVAGLIDASGAREVMLVAHDWGGAIAWEFMARRVRPVGRFVVMNMPHPALLLRELKRSPGQVLRSWYILFFQLAGLPERRLVKDGAAALERVFATGPGRPPLPKAVVDAYRANILRPGAATAMINYYRAAARWRAKPDSRSDAGAAGRGSAKGVRPAVVDAPTLMLWGDADMALGIGTTEGTRDLAPNLMFRRLAGVSHWVQQDAAEAVNAELRAWLGG